MKFGIRCWNREQENGTNIMTVLVFQDLEKARDIQDMFHRFETQNSLTHLNNLLQNMCTYL